MEDNNQYLDAILSSINKNAELYKVPEGYFNELAEQVVEKLRSEAFSNAKGYVVPEGYFNSFAENILQKVKTVSSQNTVEEELETIAPLLNTISKRNVYSIAKDYFEQLPSLLIEQQQFEKETPKVIPLSTKKYTWQKWAAAAVIAGAVLSGGLYLENYKNENLHNSSSKQYASAVSQENMNLEENLSNLSEDEIISYLAVPNPDISTKDSASLIGAASEDTQKAISSMTNEELENYLDKTPTNF
ncbi:MAG TPA: hypothetical protein VFQ86_02180 [Arachidicoccus soli]|nr:hypothetical protein [Arachidicoccus soli]